MRHSRFAVFGVLALALAGCREDGSDPVTPVIPPLAYVRYINAVPDTNNTLVRWIDQIEYVPQTFVNVPFRGQGQGNYQGVDVRAKRIRVFTSDLANFSPTINTVVLIDTSITFEAGKYYTLLHSGYARAGASPKQSLKVIEDVHATPGANVALRYINAGGVGVTSLDLYMVATATTAPTGAPSVAALGANAASAYLTRTPTTATFATAVAAAGSTTPLYTTAAPAGVAGNPFAPAANGIPAVQPVDPISGGTVAGSVMTAITFPASVTGSPAAPFAAPGMVYFLDKQPPRFTTP